MPLSPAEAVTASYAPLSRPELSLQRLPGKPPVALNLAAFGPYGEGDVFEGGEIDEIISQYNGPPPQLQLPSAQRHDGSSKEGLAPNPADNRVGRTRYQQAAPKALNLGAASLDGVLMVMPPGLLDRKPDKGKSADDPGYFIEQVVAAMKPGAVLVVVDQKPATGPEKAGDTRPPAGNKPVPVDEFEAQGLEFVGSLPAARDSNAPGGIKSGVPKEAAKPARVFDLYRKPDPAPAKGPAPAPVVPG